MAKEATHTPGPWIAEISQNPHKSAFPDNPHWQVRSADLRGKGDYVANVWAEVDARLIAAAPDLLAACVRLSEMPENAEHLREGIKIARAAIFKATGQQNAAPPASPEPERRPGEQQEA